MTDSFVKVNPDSTGKKVATSEAYDGSGNLIEIQRVTMVDDSGSMYEGITEKTGLAILAKLDRMNIHLAKIAGNIP